MTQRLLLDTLDKAIEILPSRVPSEDLHIDNIILGSSCYRITNYSIALCDLNFYLTIIGQGDSGFAYFNPAEDNPTTRDLTKYVNQNVLEVVKQDLHFPLKTALIDAVVGIYNRSIGLQPNEIYKAEGSYAAKAAIRANLLTKDIQAGESVLLIGAVSEIAKEVLARNGRLKITDLSKHKAHSHLYGIPIELTNRSTLKMMEEVDTAIITGATFSSGTIDEIIATGNKFSTKMIFYLETANNLG